MRRRRRRMRLASLCLAGGMTFQFGGCFGDFVRISAANTPVGFGRTVGTTAATLLAIPLLQPLLDPILDAIGGGV